MNNTIQMYHLQNHSEKNVRTENICSSTGGENIKQLRKVERQEEIQYTTKIGVKTNLGPSFCKIFIPSYTFDSIMPKLAILAP